MLPFTQLAQSFGLGCHQHADDTQLNLLMGSQLDAAPVFLSKGLEAEAGWLKQSRLKLNPAMTEVLCLDQGEIGLGIQLPSRW